jgi:hypothetical protein
MSLEDLVYTDLPILFLSDLGQDIKDVRSMNQKLKMGERPYQEVENLKDKLENAKQ